MLDEGQTRVVDAGPDGLKPCPFCSSKRLRIWVNSGEAYVACVRCGSSGPAQTTNWIALGDKAGVDAERSAVIGWNRRPSPE